MTNALTDKTMVLVSKMGDYWVKPEQAERIMEAKKHEPDSHIELEGNFISLNAIDGALTAEAYTTYNIKRRGGWQCKYQEWHERNQQCAHHLVRSTN